MRFVGTVGAPPTLRGGLKRLRHFASRVDHMLPSWIAVSGNVGACVNRNLNGWFDSKLIH